MQASQRFVAKPSPPRPARETRSPSFVTFNLISRKRYTFVDWATQGYMALVALLIVAFHGAAVPFWPWLVAAHAAGIGSVHVLIQTQARRPANRVLDFLRHFYPVLLYVGFYRETGELNHMLTSDYLDPVCIRFDEMIFGAQPSLTFMQSLPHWPVSEMFYAAYFSYYVMIAGVGLALYLRDRRQFAHYVSVVSFVFYVCYLVYIFTPVMGPRIFHRVINGYTLPLEVQPEVVPEFPAAVQAGPFFKIMAWIYDTFEAPGAAFPSSHVAVAITTAWFSFRYLRRIRHPHLVMVVLLCLSTVYCRYHYAVDVMAGVATAALLLPLGNWLYQRFGHLAQEGQRENPSPDTRTPQRARS
jgi:membrane-associated phospholipid phosphatase